MPICRCLRVSYLPTEPDESEQRPTTARHAGSPRPATARHAGSPRAAAVFEAEKMQTSPELAPPVDSDRSQHENDDVTAKEKPEQQRNSGSADVSGGTDSHVIASTGVSVAIASVHPMQLSDNEVVTSTASQSIPLQRKPPLASTPPGI